MIKYYNTMVVFRELPSEVTLAINITNCPCHCKGCHSMYLWDDIGIELTNKELDTLISDNDGISCVCLMGGDREPKIINDIASYIRLNHKGIKVGWYSGMEEISNDIDVKNFDYIKIGPYIEEYGGLDKETTNQKLFKVENGNLNNITYKFWRSKV